MSTFSEKIKLRRRLDAELLGRSAEGVYNSLGKSLRPARTSAAGNGAVSELSRICGYLKEDVPEFPEKMEDSEELTQVLMTETGIMRRKIVTVGKWWKDGSMPLLCQKKDGSVRAAIPVPSGGYIYYTDEGKAVPLNKESAKEFLPTAYCFYKPFENRALTLKDFYKFLAGAFGAADIVCLLTISLIAGLIGMIMPQLNRFIFNNVVPSGTSEQIFGISVLIAGTVVVSALFELSRSVWVMRIGNKLELLAQSAVWARLMNLPVSFFKKYDSGDLTQRAAAVNQICGILGGQLIPTLLASMFSFIYLFQISSISAEMFLPSFIIVTLIAAVYVLGAFLRVKQTKHNNEVNGKLSSVVFQLLGGITKIKAAGAESRAYSKWAELYGKLKIMPHTFISLSSAISNFIVFGGTVILYCTAYANGLTASDYIGFNSAYSLFTGAVISMAGITAQVASLRPAIEMLRPIIEETPENSGYKKRVDRLGGDIEVNRVKFRYNEDMPYVLDDLNIHIKAGEYVGIVGSSGCGKSTLFRVLLGFESPESGAVYYDSQDAEGLDLRSVRRRIGVVLQNGKLFSGDIYSNIVICAPWLSVDEAWQAAERSGFAEDIRKMPMGMFTMISEGGGGLSGGQQQRLLIARALASNPDIVMFDEATSALDNITQAMVVKTLEGMTATRIVIAHRLSTIRNCSRIIYLDKGKVAEEGTFEELMALDGKFAELARRQTV
ncbi:MAG: NHLP bacteriocin export ABC transporter permease/ATPase subunit [Ruminococcus sp.]|nr:NHLP bacteriocin export ABC transporter permease/ATPase subunit [Ruminococcus sp.]MCM1381280.1 NHLP bacteriocin export ABC transporter permease/ATPase subunit [Muribaculaceae bacterium]